MVDDKRTVLTSIPTPFRCFDQIAHDDHMVEVVFEYTCSGEVECGEKVHEPHRVKKNLEIRCSGLCRCGVRRETHGPGAHK